MHFCGPAAMAETQRRQSFPPLSIREHRRSMALNSPVPPMIRCGLPNGSRQNSLSGDMSESDSNSISPTTHKKIKVYSDGTRSRQFGAQTSKSGLSPDFFSTGHAGLQFARRRSTATPSHPPHPSDCVIPRDSTPPSSTRA